MQSEPEGRRPIVKPRVSRCAFTRVWILNPNGLRHTCAPGRSFKADEGFRHWSDAMDEANRVAWEKIKAAVARNVWYR